LPMWLFALSNLLCQIWNHDPTGFRPWITPKSLMHSLHSLQVFRIKMAMLASSLDTLRFLGWKPPEIALQESFPPPPAGQLDLGRCPREIWKLGCWGMPVVDVIRWVDGSSLVCSCGKKTVCKLKRLVISYILFPCCMGSRLTFIFFRAQPDASWIV
jgi:hypothetical protein